MKALVLEHGVNRGALAAVRALAADGWTVGVATSARGGLAKSSRHVHHRHELPFPEDTAAFVDAIAGAVAQERYDVVFPVDDGQVHALSEHREGIGAVVPYPDHGIVLRALDRLARVDAARRAGLATASAQPATPDALAAAGGSRVVVKARNYVATEDGRVETRIGPSSEALAWAQEIRSAGGEPIVQELLEGQLMSITTLMDHDQRLVAQEQQVAERIWPPKAGVSVRARTVTVDPELGARVCEMLAGMGWFGLAQIQFIVPPDGVPRLIDLNPRFYGSFGLALASGPNFASLWGALAIGKPVARGQVGAAGRTYHWVGGDLRRALRERDGGLMRDLARSLAWSPRAVHGVWSARDPRPAVSVLGAALAQRNPLRRAPTRG